MAPNSTVFRLQIALSDVDRSVYTDIDLRIARHPSETPEFLVTRAIAYCLTYDEAIEMGPGLSEPDAPAMSIRTGHGSVKTWVDIGTPSAERMHRASKASEQLVIFTHHDPALLVREATTRRIHKCENIEAYSVSQRLVAALALKIERNTKWDLTRTEGSLYVKVGEETLTGELSRVVLVSG